MENKAVEFKTIKKVSIAWVNKLSDSIFVKKYFYFILVLLFLSVYFFLNFVYGIDKGGRWDLYEHIAIADRFISGKGFYYSPIEASTPYFPGLAFLSVVIGTLCNPWRDYVMLVLASLSGTLLLFFLILTSKDSIKHKWIGIAIVTIVFYQGFHDYMFYMNEFKADSLILVYSFIIAIIIDKLKEDKLKYNIEVFFLLFIIALLMDVTKQQALYTDAAFGFYLLFTKKMSFKKRLLILSPLIVAGLVDIVIVFSIPNLSVTAIKNLKEMPFFCLDKIVSMSINFFRCNCIFIILMVLYAVLLIMKKTVISDIHKNWLLIAVFFAIGQFAGGIKIGGNEGNFEAGVIAFLPFVIIAADFIYDKISALFIKDDFKKAISVMCQAIMSVILIALSIHFAASIPSTLSNKIACDNAVSEYLTKKCDGEKIMYDSDNYMRVIRSNAVPEMDIYTVPLYLSEYSTLIEDTLSSQKYKYLYIIPSDLMSFDNINLEYQELETHYFDTFRQNYTSVDDDQMPDELKGRLYISNDSLQ